MVRFWKFKDQISLEFDKEFKYIKKKVLNFVFHDELFTSPFKILHHLN